MDRRTFLGTLTAAGLLSRRLGWAAESNKIDKVGLQLYTVRDLMKADFDGTLAKVAEIGYKEVEFAGYFDRSPQQVKAALAKVSLVSPSAHFNSSYLGDQWPGVLESANAIGQQYVVCSFVEESLRKQPGGWHHIAATFNQAGEAARKAGLQFAYHNHWFEFEPVEGQLPYDILLKETDPNLVKMEMDLYWATKGGADPIAYFNRYPGRFPLVHVKGMAQDGSMTAVGADNRIDWKKIFADRNGGIQHYFVEHDNPTSPLDSIRASYAYLSQLRF
jgi:sugar phosphate isomerase/epimerase